MENTNQEVKACGWKCSVLLCTLFQPIRARVIQQNCVLPVLIGQFKSSGFHKSVPLLIMNFIITSFIVTVLLSSLMGGQFKRNQT